MNELSAARANWDEIEKRGEISELETRRLRAMTVQESLQQQLELQIAFEKQLQETAGLFAGERRAALAELQARLLRLAEWQAAHGTVIQVDPGNPGPPG